jgi:phosphoglycolate phosphatase-like HAD superfamily hydrolase
MLFENKDIYIFFDDGDVLNNNKIRGKQWQKLVGEFMAPKFGGNPEDWGAANSKIIEDFINKGIPTLMYEHKEKTHNQFIEWFRERWINDMFDYVGITRPDRANYEKVYYDTAEYVDLRVQSAFPGVIESIKILYDNGFNLYTASGTESIELNFYLKGMGIRQYFRKLYGPDLINILKVDDMFYKAIVKDLEIEPYQAIFIDDKPYYLNMAKKIGVRVIQACLTGEFRPQFEYVVKDMKKLPEIIENLRDNSV